MSLVRPPVPIRYPAPLVRDGVAYPYVNARRADGSTDPVTVHAGRLVQCFREGRCQLDGQQIAADEGLVFVGGPGALRDLVFDLPGLHRECAVYASQVCPVLGNRLATLPDGEPNHDWYVVYARACELLYPPGQVLASVPPRHVTGVRLASKVGVGRVWEKITNLHGLRVRLLEESRRGG
jgi:hypothetical protein